MHLSYSQMADLPVTALEFPLFPLKFTCVHFYLSHCGMCSSRFSMFQSSHSYTLDL